MAFPYKRVALVGVGKSNLSVARYLTNRGVSLILCDKNPDCIIPDSMRNCCELRLGESYACLDGADCIFVSPGIRRDLPWIQRAEENGVIVSNEAALFFSLCPAKIIAVTGSDGKTTTTTMVYNILLKGHSAALCGNVGIPMMDTLDTLREDAFAAVELSSFQLMSLAPRSASATITNVTENHLNWHTDMNEYISAKLNVYKNTDRAVINADDSICQKINGSVYFSTTQSVGELRSRHSAQGYASIENGDAFLYEQGERRRMFSLSDLRVKGEHNLKNALAAAVLCAPFCSDSDISEALKEFRGVPHRAEIIGEHNEITFIDSSIDSTPSRTAATLSSLGGGCVVICGGRNKGLSYEPLCETLLRYARAVVFTGECGEDMMSALSQMRNGATVDARYEPDFDRAIPNTLYEPDFDRAVALAASVARAGEKVVLSPAATSFDTFNNYVERSERFKMIIQDYINSH